MRAIKRSKVLVLVILIAFLSVFLAGCVNNHKTYGKSDYDKIVDKQLEQINTAYKATREQLDTTMAEKQKQKLYFTPVQVNELKIIRNNVSKNNYDLNKHMLDTAYPKTVAKFGNATEDYINTLDNKHTVKQAQQSYHKLMKEMKPLLIYMRTKKTLALANMALSSDNLNYPDFFPEKKKANFKQVLILTDPVEPKHRGSKGIDYHKSTISMVLISLLGILMLVVLFLQKPKDNSNMDVLTDTGGSDLFSRPKPRGYNKFMLIATKVMISVFVAILVIIQVI